MPVMAITEVLLAAVLVFVGLVLMFALLAGRCHEVKISARLGKVVDIGTHVRFDTESTQPLPRVRVVEQGRGVDSVWCRSITDRRYASSGRADRFDD